MRLRHIIEFAKKAMRFAEHRSREDTAIDNPPKNTLP